MKIDDIKRRQKTHFSNEKSAVTTITKDELEDYIDQVTNKYHKDRKEEWAKGYAENYKMRLGTPEQKGKIS